MGRWGGFRVDWMWVVEDASLGVTVGGEQLLVFFGPQNGAHLALGVDTVEERPCGRVPIANLPIGRPPAGRQKVPLEGAPREGLDCRGVVLQGVPWGRPGHVPDIQQIIVAP